jgi:hypothetical protein
MATKIENEGKVAAACRILAASGICSRIRAAVGHQAPALSTTCPLVLG